MITPLEAILIIAVIFLLLIFFKPETIVKFARSLGELRREMKRGEKESEEKK
ncbi:MAG: twin-arginine translocase TatA/TatE family subunit [Nitrososphaerota archaeon]|nr:twin-arginine translocase TatA/TatE family subunit [Candidatus Calditenuaceae archaeon]MDW8072648.1 twin-arginine translocase TatA/TatE family subunit [Nitrososphaerota archaeon]